MTADMPVLFFPPVSPVASCCFLFRQINGKGDGAFEAGWIGAAAAGKFQGRLHRLARRNDPLDQSESEGLGCTDRLSGENEFFQFTQREMV